MKILVTGANGYIGSRVVSCLCGQRVEVIATDMASDHIDPRAHFVPCNLFEKREDWFSFFDKPDAVLHLAWRNGFVHNATTHMDDLSGHWAFLKNLIDGGIARVACMGTMHEVGYHEGAVDENTPCSPLSLYGVSKCALRDALKVYCQMRGTKFQWLRAFYIYGNDEFGNSIFCKIRSAEKQGQKTFPFTSGKNQYDFIHVDELAKQISDCVSQDAVLGVINCCSGKPVSLGKQIENYIKTNGLKIQLAYGQYPDRPYDSPCIYGDDTKIKEIIRRKQ